MTASMSLSSAFLAAWEPELANTRRMVERVPDDRADWRPHPRSMSLGRLTQHLVDMTGWVPMMLESDSADVQGYQPAPVPSVAELLAALDRNAAATRTALAAADDDRMRATWTLRNGDQMLFTLPRHTLLHGSVLHHSIHHRGQLSVYLRLNDIPVPGMYGPSADEA